MAVCGTPALCRLAGRARIVIATTSVEARCGIKTSVFLIRNSMKRVKGIGPTLRFREPGATRQAPKKTRRPGSGDGTYEAVPILEVRRRAELYGLRVDRLRAELLDRRQLEIELGQIFGAIRAIIAGTRMSSEEKEDVYRQLMSVPELLEIVAEKQTRQEPMRTSKEVLNGDEEN